ncbi:hypothetical protein BLA29_003984 [Euroglyphus maynei]|uniref:Uncharacterized protein n=1 Tax=Euroglyphus maynei TaxID=6958 RepID=A0A1Y3BQ21_EURMA|nr:hypothetical protein BLA29_003984 [Euroglyphus maynei]
MVFQLANKNDPQSSSESMPTPEQLRNESKKKLMHNILYFGFIVAGLRFAASMLNDGSPIDSLPDGIILLLID